MEASQILFGNATSDALKRLDEDTLLAVFEGVPQYDILRSDLEAGISIVDLLADKTSIMSSKGEARRALKSNAISLNKEKVTDQELIVNAEYLIDDKFILLQSGKKNYFLLNGQIIKRPKGRFFILNRKNSVILWLMIQRLKDCIRIT